MSARHFNFRMNCRFKSHASMVKTSCVNMLCSTLQICTCRTHRTIVGSVRMKVPNIESYDTDAKQVLSAILADVVCCNIRQTSVSSDAVTSQISLWYIVGNPPM